jgi:hypothetical protein
MMITAVEAALMVNINTTRFASLHHETIPNSKNQNIFSVIKDGENNTWREVRCRKAAEGPLEALS